MRKILLSLCVLFFSACAQNPIPNEEFTLENTQWKLVSFGYKRMAVPKNVWIIFKEGIYSGHCACNGMGGAYEVDKNTLEIKAGISRLIACPDMRLETKIRQEIQEVNSYKFENKQLILMHGKEAILNFIEVPSE